MTCFFISSFSCDPPATIVSNDVLCIVIKTIVCTTWLLQVFIVLFSLDAALVTRLAEKTVPEASLFRSAGVLLQEDYIN